MDRLKRSDEGFTLLELVIAIALSAVVLLSASNLLINFGKFSSNVVKSEALLMGTALGAFEEITGKITVANKVAIRPESAITSYPTVAQGCAGGSCIQVRVDHNNTPSVFTDDTTYTYWLNVGNLMRNGASGDPPAGRTLAGGLYSLSFSRVAPALNRIRIVLEARGASGPTGAMSREHLETTAIMRSQSAN